MQNQGPRRSVERHGLRGFASPGQDQLSYHIIFFCYLSAQAVQFGFPNWTNPEASFCWPATIGAKICGIRELKATIQTILCHTCSPHLYSVIDADSTFECSPSHACYPTPVLFGHPSLNRIEYASHGSVTVTRCTFTTSLHFLFIISAIRSL